MVNSEDFSLIDYWRVVVRRRWAVYLTLAVSLGVALIWAFTATPLYRATSTLQIQRKNPDILTFRDLSQVDYSWTAYNDYYQTQYKLIASESVARKAVQRLGLASYVETESGNGSGLLGRLLSWGRSGDSSSETSPEDVATAQVMGGLEVTPVRNSYLVRVSWVSDDPDLAAQVANGVAEAYIQLSMESQFSMSGQAEEFLVDQIGKLRQELAEMESTLQQYGEAKRIVSIDDSNNLTLQALMDINEEQTRAQTTLAAAEAAYRAALESPPEALPEVMHSDLIAQLRREHAELENELAEQSERFGSDWPGIQTLQSKMRQAKTRLDAETMNIAEQVRASSEAVYLRAKKELDNLDRLLEQKQDAAQRLKRDAVEFANLKADADKKRETLNRLIGRQNEMALSTRLKDLDAASSNIRIMDRAKTPKVPFRPNTKLNLALGLCFGLLAGIGLAIVLDQVDNSIGSVEQLRRLVELPVLAVIPRHGSSGSPLVRVRRKPTPKVGGALDLVAHRDGKASASEAYRDLRTAILMSNPGRPPRTILVTSAVPEEGKTATAINLGVVFAQLGSRVLLVDTDLRRPRLHKAFGVSNRRGISNILSGLVTDSSQVILRTEIDNLDLLASGPIPPNPSELLNSATFLETAQGFLDLGYDHVIFDSPPVLSVADSVVIANVVDSCVLVARAGRTARQSIRSAVEKLQRAGKLSLGLVLNDLSPDADGAATYGYRYYGLDDDTVSEPAEPGKTGGAAGA